MSSDDDFQIYEEQLKHIRAAIIAAPEGPERDELVILQSNIEELLALTRDNNQDADNQQPSTSSKNIDDEYARFQAELATVADADGERKVDDGRVREGGGGTDWGHLEGTKCRVPHAHLWGGTAYHNAIVCSVIGPGDEDGDVDDYDDVKVRILFINPTHEEMVPCKYFLNGTCIKMATNSPCRHSHGEIVAVSQLREYIEPQFDMLAIGCHVLAKRATSDLWHRAIVKRIYDNDLKCLVKFSESSDEVVLIEHVLPLLNDDDDDTVDSISDDDDDLVTINNTLLIQSNNNHDTGGSSNAAVLLGDWEKYTKGIGSKLMEKMGYVNGAGLGRRSDGRVEPVTAVILPSGKSLDYCMKLRETAGGGDENYFDAERRLKKIRKKKHKINGGCQQNGRRRRRPPSLKPTTTNNNTSVFNFLNKTLSNTNDNNNKSKIEFDEENTASNIKSESIRNLNVASLKIVEHIKKVELDLYKIKESLTRHSSKDNASSSQTHRILKEKLIAKEWELQKLQKQSTDIANEQKTRSDRKKMTIF